MFTNTFFKKRLISAKRPDGYFAGNFIYQLCLTRSDQAVVATEPVRSWRQSATLRAQYVGDRVIFGSLFVLLNKGDSNRANQVIGVPCEKRSLLRQLLRLVMRPDIPALPPAADCGIRLILLLT